MSEPGVALAISASSGGYTCALRRGGGEVVPGELEVPGGLAPAVAALCVRAGCTPRELTEIRLDLGPGSYTGLRVAVTFARTIQAFGGASVVVATSLELMALQAWHALGVDRAAVVRPILDARRGRWHHGAVCLEDGAALLDEPSAEPLEQVSGRVGSGEVLLAEQGCHDRLAAMAAARRANLVVFEAAPGALCELLFHPWLRPRVPGPGGIEPLYLMGSYADS